VTVSVLASSLHAAVSDRFVCVVLFVNRPDESARRAAVVVEGELEIPRSHRHQVGLRATVTVARAIWLAALVVIANSLVCGVAFAEQTPGHAAKSSAPASSVPASSRPASSSPALAAGDESCAECHENEVEGFRDSIHGRAFGRSLQAEARGGSCESCHGSGEAHVESEGAAADIVGFGVDSDASRSNAVCLECHTKDSAQMHWDTSAHQSANVACTSCHAAHPAAADKPFVRGGVNETCLACHTDQRRGFLMRSRHPLGEGKMDCTSCHSPHGSSGPSLLAAHDVFETCTKCHAEMRGPFLWEHAPVRESCLNCHAPHGSNHENLLVTTNFRLCQSCHIQGRHQTVAGSDARFFMTNRGCTNCHAQVHGTNHPSGPNLQR
jgi:DmsE family decaheme c-type cytochrome